MYVRKPVSGWLAALLLLAALPAASQDVLQGSPDTTVELGVGDTILRDESIAISPSTGIVTRLQIPGVPRRSELTAYHVTAGAATALLLSFQNHVELPGLLARAGDVVRLEAGVFTTEFDAGAAGVPLGVHVDAVSESAGGLLLSFDTSVEISAGVVADDEDLVEWDGVGLSLFLDGSSVGMDRALDVDAAQDLGSSVVAVSFDTGGSVGGVVFEDEDLVEYDGVTGTWTLAFDGSAVDGDWAGTDLDAAYLPEPAAPVGLAAGLTLLAHLRSRRRRAGR